MKHFSDLYRALDQTTATNKKIAAMHDYFRSASGSDSAWALYFLSGRRIKRLVSAANLRQWMIDASDLPPWLVEETYANVGDFAETAALLSDTRGNSELLNKLSLSEWMTNEILVLRAENSEQQRKRIQRWWNELDYDTCYLVNKLLTGGLRVGVSQLLVARAIAEYAGIPRDVILHRMMGHWEPNEDFYHFLIAPDDGSTDHSRPYPFCLASPLDQQLDEENLHHLLGDVKNWHIEWKWNGIRAQLIRRNKECFIWTRGEDLVTDRYPEIRHAAASLEDGIVMDGELLAWSEDEGVMEFSMLQKRIGRKTVGKKLLKEVPVCFMAFDLIECDRTDYRHQNTSKRRATLEQLLAKPSNVIKISPLLDAKQWQQAAHYRQQSYTNRVEGLMLKHVDAKYEIGRKRGQWWKWKVDPYTVDAVMLYAQLGHGRRANLFTDYTFAIWRNDELVTFAKAYSGLTNDEIIKLDKWIRQNTIDRFGPVRSIKPEQVFELAFEGISYSKRHKSGLAVRFPRISRWRHDLSAKDADSIEDVHALMQT